MGGFLLGWEGLKGAAAARGRWLLRYRVEGGVLRDVEIISILIR